MTCPFCNPPLLFCGQNFETVNTALWSTSSSQIALQSNSDFRLPNGPLPVSSNFDLFVQFLILNELTSVCTHFLYPFLDRRVSRVTGELVFNI
jgi:hypothetical protein